MAQLIFRTNIHDQIWHKSIEDLLEKKMPDTTFDFNFLAAMMDKPNLVRSFDASWGRPQVWCGKHDWIWIDLPMISLSALSHDTITGWRAFGLVL